MNILERFRHINTFVFDIDGVMTNGELLVTADGDLLRTMNIRDGYATQLAIKKGYHVWIISGGKQQAVAIRLQRLGVKETHVAVENKKECLLGLFAKHGTDPARSLYMGDDIPDYAVMQLCGIATCPADAAPEIMGIAHYVSPFPGGTGCVRDVIEKVMKLNGDWELPE